MKAVDFINGTDNYSCCKNHFNIHKYRELTTNPDYKKLFTANAFISLLWASHDLVFVEKINHIKIIRYFILLALTKKQLLYLLENLLLTFNRHLFPDLPLPKNDKELNLCLDFISIQCDKLTARLNTDIYNQCYLFDFNLIKKNIETIPGIFDILKYLESVKTDFLQYEKFHGLSRQTYFVSCCDDEIKKLLNILEYGKFQVVVSLPDTDHASQFKSYENIWKHISDKINMMDILKWNYFFFSNHDFNLLVSALTEYFFSGFIDPEFKLILKPHCKTRLCSGLYSIYNHLCIAPLKYNDDFLSLLQKLSIFEGYTTLRIYQCLIKNSE